ncbi:MAG TPA: RNA polymerase sigma factor [Solirubrobacteraceae bacterium]|nr:RNA polymerase sigma factor [Solirubrobacteraceae bacterium]
MRLPGPGSRRSDDGTAIARSLKAPEAFAEVFDRHFATVHRYLARRTTRDRADDLAAQTFTVAFAHRERYRDDLGTARPWLLGIATNLLRADYRAAQRELNAIDALAREGDPAAASAAPAPDHDLEAALAKLHPDQRDALLLHALAELSYAEIAAALSIPIGTVRSRISRACAALRDELEPLAPVAGARRDHA